MTILFTHFHNLLYNHTTQNYLVYKYFHLLYVHYEAYVVINLYLKKVFKIRIYI